MRKRIIITGGSGFVGQILQRGLRKKGYEIDVFDRYRGWLVNLVRGKYFGTSDSENVLKFSFWLNDILCQWEGKLLKTGRIRPTSDDVLAPRADLVKRFQGASAVIHLAGVAHAGLPGFSDDDYRRINYTGAINVFEAAREAAIPKFIFASSVAAYGGNSHFNGIKMEQFPVLETNPCPSSPEDSFSGIYGVLKKEFEDYLLEACRKGNTKAIALRLDAPGFKVKYGEGLITSTSIENLIEGFDCALRSDWSFNFEVINLLDKEADPKNYMEVQKVLEEHWPGMPNFTTGNMMPFSTAKISSLLGYKALPNGRYLNEEIVYIKEGGERKRKLGLVTKELTALTSPGDTVILVDEEPSQLAKALAKRRVLPFLEKDGQYWGQPADDENAIQELERMRKAGAKFMVFPWTTFWWLDYYVGLRDHLNSKFHCSLKNDKVVAFDLKQ